MTEVDLQPDVLEVLQAEDDDDGVVIPVCVETVKSPVRTQSLPRKGGSTRTRLIGTTPVRVLTADHFRAKVTLMHPGAESFYFALSEAASQDLSSMSVWPANVPCVIECTTEVWLAVAETPAEISITTERWAAGEC